MTSTKNHTFLTPGERLKYAFGQIGISQGDAAKSVFVTPGQISKWVLNQNAITPNAALAFEARLGIRSDWVLKGDGAMLLDDMGQLTEEERYLLTLYRKADSEARQEIIMQSEFQVGRSRRRKDRGS